MPARIRSTSSLPAMSTAIRRSASARWSCNAVAPRSSSRCTATASARATAATNWTRSGGTGPPSSATRSTPHGPPVAPRMATATRQPRRLPEPPNQSIPTWAVSATGPAARRARAGRPCDSASDPSQSAPAPLAARATSRPSRRSRTATRSWPARSCRSSTTAFATASAFASCASRSARCVRIAMSSRVRAGASCAACEATIGRTTAVGPGSWWSIGRVRSSTTSAPTGGVPKRVGSPPRFRRPCDGSGRLSAWARNRWRSPRR